MTIEKTAIEDLEIINPTVFEDTRGCFFEAYNQAKFLGYLSIKEKNLLKKSIQLWN